MRGRGALGVRRADVMQRSEASADPTPYRELFAGIDDGFCVVEILTDDAGEPRDYRFLDCNPRFSEHTGLEDAVGRTALELVPELEHWWVRTYGAVGLTGEPVRFEHEAPAMGRTFAVHAFRVGAPERRCVAIFFKNVTERRAAEERLRESEARFREFADRAPAKLWVTEEDGRCSFLSQRWTEFTGQPVEEGLGFGWLDVVHPDDRDRARDEFLQASAERRVVSLEHRLRRADGSYGWVLDRGRPRTGEDGRFLGYIGSVIDIDDRRRAEASARAAELRFRALFAQQTCGLAETDLEGRFLRVNERYCEITGYSHEELLGLRMQDLTHEDDLTGNVALFERLTVEGGSFEVSKRYVRKDGSAIWVRNAVTAVSDADGRTRSIVALSLDESSTKAAELERERLLADAEGARADAEQANRAKDEFLAVVSHELRTPLNAMLGWATLLQSDRLGGSAREQAIDAILRSARAQAVLIEDLLDVSRIVSGKLRIERRPVVVRDVVEAAIRSAQPSAAAKRIEIVHRLDDDAGPVLGDAARLEQVISNLLSNAVKFSPSAGRIEVTLARAGEGIEVRVADSGVGIAPEFLPFVFDRFRQADSSSARAHSGLGLGLAIVKQLVDLHGGRIRAESEGRGCGAVFAVWLPCAARSSDAAGRAAARASGDLPRLSGISVLAVDDEPDARALVEALLRAAGAEVAVASSAREALELLERDRFDVLVSDLGMPESDGLDLIRSLRGGGGGARDLPAVALTALARTDDRRRALLAGFHAHLAKPVDPDELVGVVARLADPPMR